LINSDEESFRIKIQNLQNELNHPNHFKGHLNELASLVRMQEDTPGGESIETLDEDSLESVHNYLVQQNAGITHLMDTMKQDTQYVNIMLEETERMKYHILDKDGKKD